MDSQIPEWVMQLFLLVVAVCVFFSGRGLARESPWIASVMFVGALVLTVVAAVGPSRISRFSADMKGVAVELRATPEEVESTIAVAVEGTTLPPAEVQRITEQAETRAKESRTDADYLVLAAAALRDKDYEEELRFALNGLAMPSSDRRVKALLLNRKADAYLVFGAPQKSLEAYDEAIEVDPTLVDSHNNRGSTLSSIGSEEEAERAYAKAIELDPDKFIYHLNRGLSLYLLGRFDDALESIDRAIQLSSDFAPPYDARGQVLRGLGRHEDALVAISRGIELDPNDAGAHNNRGALLFELKRFDPALASLDRATSLDSENSR